MIALSIVLKATVTIALTLAVVRLASRTRAAVRHVLLVAAFGVLLALPLTAYLVPSIRIPVAVPAPAQAVMLPLEEGPPVAASRSVAGTNGAADISSSSRPSVVQLAAWTWAAGVVLFILPVVLGLAEVRRLRRAGTCWQAGTILVSRLSAEGAIGRRVQVLLHETAPGPMTCGFLDAAIVLPRDAGRWAADDLRRAVVHELEHVRRGDWLTHCMARSVCALYWFNPLVWVAWRRLVLEAERACDDAVLHRAYDDAVGHRSEATDYADQLVGLAERLSTARHQPLLAMANRADLKARVRAVLDVRQARGPAGAFTVRMAAGLAALLVTAISPLRIAAAVQLSAGDGPRFAVVSVKPCENEAPTPPGQRSSQGGFPVVSPGTFTIECARVERLISQAYVINGDPLANQNARFGDDRWLKGLPSWVRSEKFTIEAKADGTPDRAVMLGPMLRALLEDRFKLKIHRETDEAAIYVMTVAKGGLKLQPMAKDGCTDASAADALSMLERQSLALSDKPICGAMNMLNNGGLHRWVIGGTTLPHFADTLSGFIDRHVVNKTSVDGEFNIRLEFAADEHLLGPNRINGPPAPAPQRVDGPNIFLALEQQLGLKLESDKGPHGFLVVDHIERPSPNGAAVALTGRR